MEKQASEQAHLDVVACLHVSRIPVASVYPGYFTFPSYQTLVTHSLKSSSWASLGRGREVRREGLFALLERGQMAELCLLP